MSTPLIPGCPECQRQRSRFRETRVVAAAATTEIESAVAQAAA